MGVEEEDGTSSDVSMIPNPIWVNEGKGRTGGETRDMMSYVYARQAGASSSKTIVETMES